MALPAVTLAGGAFFYAIRNAQEATSQDGSITISTASADSVATISIADTGSGMTQEFIRDRLFRPFDSTKGTHGMGIGAVRSGTTCALLAARSG